MAQDTKGNIENIHGGPVITPTPHAGLIEGLERMLEQARSGEIVGLYGAITYGDTSAGTRALGLANRSTLGALVVVQHELAEDL